MGYNIDTDTWDVELVDTLPGLPTKVRDLTGMDEFYALVWLDCTCFDKDHKGNFLMNQKGFVCPVHKSGETNINDHCYCGYPDVGGNVNIPCQIHALNPLQVAELDLVALWIQQAVKSSSGH